MNFNTKSAHIELLVKNNQAIVAVKQLKGKTTYSFQAEDFLELLTNGISFMRTDEGDHIKMIFNRDVGHLRTAKGNSINTYIEKALLVKLTNELIKLVEVPYIHEGGWMSW